MANVLQRHFPVIRDRQEALEEIGSKRRLREIFGSWEKRRQEEFLDYFVKAVFFVYICLK